MKKIISIVSTKGGVGKTTLTANMAGYLSDLGYIVLMIDADPQPSLSSYYNINHKSPLGLMELMHNPDRINDCISTTDVCDLIYSNDSDNTLQNWLLSQADGRFRLKKALSFLKKDYDFILIDTQGARGSLQDAAAISAHELISPILPELATIREFTRGTLSMLSGLDDLAFLGVEVPTLYALIYKINQQTVDARHYSDLFIKKTNEENKYKVLKTQIPESVVFKDATSRKIPVSRFANGNTKDFDKSFKSVKALKSLVKELDLIGRRK